MKRIYYEMNENSISIKTVCQFYNSKSRPIYENEKIKVGSGYCLACPHSISLNSKSKWVDCAVAD